MCDHWPLDENGWRVNDVGCTHDGAPCNACLAGEERVPRFFRSCGARGVIVPTEGTWLVLNGKAIQVHTARKEADYMLNRCEPGDICGAQDGCNAG